MPNRSYPLYKYLVSPLKPNSSINNRQVIPYNLYLLKKYSAYINIKIYSSIKSIFYLYKYIYKGLNQANISLINNYTRNNNNPTPNSQPRIRTSQEYGTTINVASIVRSSTTLPLYLQYIKEGIPPKGKGSDQSYY